VARAINNRLNFKAFMFQQFKNIDTAFRYIRLFSFLFLIVNCAICFYVLNTSRKDNQQNRNRIYILANGKLMDAIGINRSDSLAVEIRDHVKTFHNRFYDLEPDDAIIKKQIAKALYLCDAAAEYDNLCEKGYYSTLISANVTQRVEDPDSIYVDINKQPYYFKYFGKIKMKRKTSIVTRSLVTEGYIRTENQNSDNNPHGLFIENWKVLENKDLNIENREYAKPF
jgi:conjugative transposon TraK protein